MDLIEIFTSSYPSKSISHSYPSDFPTPSELALFSTADSINMYKIFSGLTLTTWSALTDDTVLSLARLDAWIFTVLQNLTLEISSVDTRQKKYWEFFGKMIQLATNQIFGTVSLLLKYREPQELRIPDNKFRLDQQKSDVFKMDREATMMIESPSTNKLYTAVDKNWCVQYIGPQLGVNDLCISKFDQDYLQVTALGSNFHTQCLAILPPDQGSSLNQGISSCRKGSLALS